MQEPQRVHIRVEGRVQGVGFRLFTVKEARRRSLRGFVRNLPNGDVDIEAEGPPVEISEFVERVREGPPGAVVAQVSTDSRPARGEEASFNVRY